MQKLTLDVFGRRMLAECDGKQWRLYLPGPDGKRRLLTDIVVPGDIRDAESLLVFLDDCFHEYARPGRERICIVN